MIESPSSQRRPFFRRPTILLTMTVVALIAVVLSGVRARIIANEARVRMDRMRADLAHAEARSAWSERMQSRGYVSPSRVQEDRAALDKIRAEIKEFDGR